MSRVLALPGLFLRALIITYQWTLRPMIGANCRFAPSCSDYALQAIARHGALPGTVMATGRILRCNPWHAGGDDPVPCTCPRLLSMRYLTVRFLRFRSAAPS